MAATRPGGAFAGGTGVCIRMLAMTSVIDSATNGGTPVTSS